MIHNGYFIITGNSIHIHVYYFIVDGMVYSNRECDS